MRNRVLLFISACLYYSGLMSLITWLHRHSSPRLLVVNYHRASGEHLKRQLVYLHKHFRVYFLDATLEELFASAKQELRKKDRRLPLAVTFDDGYEDNFTYAYPLARELQLPITIFLISDYIDCGAAFWWQDHLLCYAQVEQIEFKGCTYHMQEQEDQKLFAKIVDAQYRLIEEPAARRHFLCSLGQLLSIPDTNIPHISEVPASMLTWAQIREMQESKWVRFGGHTMHHVTLSSSAKMEEAIHEVIDCRLLLQTKLGRPVRVFAYPHGGIEHIGCEGIVAVQQAGYQWAVTTVPGANTPQTHPYLIRRISSDSCLHWLIVALMTSGVWDFLSHFNWVIKRIKYRNILRTMPLALSRKG